MNVLAQINGIDQLAVFDGVNDANGASGESHPGLADSDQNQIVVTDPAVLASVFTGTGNNLITGDAGNDILFGNTGNDEMHGGTGDDVLYGWSGNDLLFGNAGNDFCSAVSVYPSAFCYKGTRMTQLRHLCNSCYAMMPCRQRRPT